MDQDGADQVQFPIEDVHHDDQQGAAAIAPQPQQLVQPAGNDEPQQVPQPQPVAEGELEVLLR